jgi:hypothetical protein
MKIKVNLYMCFFFLNWAPRHEGLLGEWRYSSTHSFNSAIDGSEWSASRPGRFTPRETAPGTHRIGSWVGPRAVLDAMAKRKIPAPAGNRTVEPDRPACNSALYRLSYHCSSLYVILALNHKIYLEPFWTEAIKIFSSTTLILSRSDFHRILETSISQNLNGLETHLPLTQ